MTAPDFRFTVDGMMCQKNCGTTVEKALSNVPGVKLAKITFAKKLAEVWLEPNGIKVSEAELIDAIECVGFDASPYSHGGHGNNSEPSTSVPYKSSSSSSSSSSTTSKFEAVINPLHAMNESMSQVTDFLELKIGGMSCANCVKSIEKKLSSMQGVASIKIALLSEKAEIKYNANLIKSDTITKLIVEMGYTCRILHTKSLIGSAGNNSNAASNNSNSNHKYLFKISGMSCSNCVTKLEQLLSEHPAIEKVKISLLTNKMSVVLSIGELSFYIHFLHICL